MNRSYLWNDQVPFWNGFSASPGTMYMLGNGVITKAGWETGYGNTIEVDHGFGYKTIYAHLSSIKVKRGSKVVRGE